MTQKERKAAYNKAWYQENKAKKLAKNKAWRDANKERSAVNAKAYREVNKEEIRVKAQAYYKANKEKIDAYNNSKRISTADGLYTVYYLPKENYVGMTSNLSWRLRGHKNRNNRKVEDVEIFGKYETKREALDAERELHSLGYAGANPTHLKHQQLNN